MLKKLFPSLILAFFICSPTFSQNVGVNTLIPLYDLDVRGTDDKSDGGEFQIATPTMTNFLRFFGGRTDDKNPFMAFNETDTFHFVTTLPDFSTYNRRMTLFPDGKLGLGTDRPKAELDIRTNEVDDGTELHLSNSDASHFLRLFSGRPGNPRPSVFWNFGSVLDFARFDGNLDYQPFLSLDGKRINVLNTNGSVLIGEDAGFSDEGSFNTAVGSFSMQNNVSGNRNTVLGYNAAGSGDGANSGNVLLGYQAGFNLVGSDRLYIENSSSALPLIYGEFDNNLIRINGRQEVTGNLNLNQGISSGVALRINGQEALWSNGTYFSYGFGADYNYFAKPMRIGPTEGSIMAYADLHVLDNLGVSNLSIESYAHDAMIQLSGNTNSATTHWTIRRRGTDGDLEWRHNTLRFMRLTTLGRLGLGVDNPTKTLEIAGDSYIYKSINSSYPNQAFVSTIENTSNTNTTYNNGLSIIAGHDDFIGGMTFPLQPIFIDFRRPDGTTLGGIHQRSSNGLIFYEMSDRRHKREIQNTKTGINTLMKIKVRDYKWKEGKRNQSSITGFIAQELFEVYPSAAKKGGGDQKTDPWQVAPTQLIPLMVKSTQDHQNEIKALKKENAELKKRLEKIEKILGL